ncbi:MAG: nucleotidyltransferase domain-containing protein [bacterium]
MAMTEDKIIASGFPKDKGTLIHAFVGGSALHGVKLEVTNDTDLYGVYVENPTWILGVDLHEHFVSSTSPQETRNSPSDVDVTCYSLRKWANLAIGGNPTILQFLFTPARRDEISWSSILGERHLFLAKSHAKKYMGYADAQLHRMMGLKGQGKHGQRPELEGQFGYDVKAAMHALRLLLEGIELMRTGFVIFPRPPEECEMLLEIRRGEWSQEKVIRRATKVFEELRAATYLSPLPAKINRIEVSDLIARIYLQEWNAIHWEALGFQTGESSDNRAGRSAAGAGWKNLPASNVQASHPMPPKLGGIKENQTAKKTLAMQ